MKQGWSGLSACLGATLAVLSGCASLDTNLSVDLQPLPTRFQAVAAGPSVADLEWRRFFAEPNLQALIDLAIRNNVDLHVALQRIETARSSVRLANAALLPRVDLNVAGGVRKFGLYTMDGAGNASTFIRPNEIVPANLTDIFLGIQSSWEIDLWGKLRNQRKAAIASYLESIEGTNLVISTLVATVASQYSELLALDEELAILRQTIQKQKDALSVIKWQKQAGRATELAVEQFSAQLMGARALKRSVKQQIVQTENSINLLLGRFPEPINRSNAAFYAQHQSALTAGLPSQLLANRPDVREAELQIQASHYDLRAARAAFFPQFNVTGTLGFQAFNPEFLFTAPASLAYSAMGSVITPLINRAALQAQFNTAKASQITAMYNYQRVILNAYVEVANELANIENLRAISQRRKQQSEMLKLAVETSEYLYKSGRATYLEILLAQQNALQANLDLVQVVKQQRLATITLYKALGGGWR